MATPATSGSIIFHQIPLRTRRCSPSFTVSTPESEISAISNQCPLLTRRFPICSTKFHPCHVDSHYVPNMSIPDTRIRAICQQVPLLNRRSSPQFCTPESQLPPFSTKLQSCHVDHRHFPRTFTPEAPIPTTFHSCIADPRHVSLLNRRAPTFSTNFHC